MPSSTRDQTTRPAVFSTRDREQFLRDGYIVVREAFPRALAEAAIPHIWEASPFKGDDRTTWTQALAVVAKSISTPPFDGLYTPRVVQVMDELLGEGRYALPSGSGYAVLNFPGFAKGPWEMYGGHVDGNFFHHHLDSREQGLVLLFIYADLAKNGGGTGIRPGSHLTTARVLAAAEPGGLSCGDVGKQADLASKHIPPIEAIGNAGDMVVMHPFTFHGSSSNLSDRPRMASNMCVGLHEKMNLKRENAADYSLVELAIVQALAKTK